MQKYNIEGSIDFFSELNKLLNKENVKNENVKNEENICLISNEELTDNFVKLNCGHSFNYLPLYKDLVNQKQTLPSNSRPAARKKNDKRSGNRWAKTHG